MAAREIDRVIKPIDTLLEGVENLVEKCRNRSLAVGSSCFVFDFGDRKIEMAIDTDDDEYAGRISLEPQGERTFSALGQKKSFSRTATVAVLIATLVEFFEIEKFLHGEEEIEK